MITYQVNTREEYGNKEKKEEYDGPSLLAAYRIHDDLVQEFRMTGPIMNLTVTKTVTKEDGGTVTSYLQHTQVKNNKD